MSFLNQSNGVFRGKGKTSQVFTLNEEYSLTQRYFFCYFAFLTFMVFSSCRILDLSDGGKNLSFNLICDLITKEIDLLRESNPERDLRVSRKSGTEVSKGFCRGFAIRNGLHKYISFEAQYSHKMTAECDVCCKKFTTDKNMKDHRKRIHFGFLT